MDLLKTPSIQSLVDSDIGSIESLQSLDIEELDEREYALPVTDETPSLQELLQDEQDPQEEEECSALQLELLQAVSQQLASAEERSGSGCATSLASGAGGRLAAGTAHGHVLAFQGGALRWACASHADRGAVTCLAYSGDGTRLLAGYAAGLICQYGSEGGVVLRRVTPGGGAWGALRVAWADRAALALDTGGSVWLLKFSRPLGVRQATASCLFSGARGEVVSMCARAGEGRVVALATLARVVCVCGGRAAALRLPGAALACKAPVALPALAWHPASPPHTLLAARALTLLTVRVSLSPQLALTPLRQLQLDTPPLWIGFLRDSLALLDTQERLRLLDDDDNRSLDLSPFHIVYASAFFKGVWSEGRVSAGLAAAGASALGGCCASEEGALVVLGRAGVVRVSARGVLARCAALAPRRPALALRLLLRAAPPPPPHRARPLLLQVAAVRGALHDPSVANPYIQLCLKYHFSEELWVVGWEAGSESAAWCECVAEALAGGAGAEVPPPPPVAQALLGAGLDEALLARALHALPLTALDPHAATLYARDHRLWLVSATLAAMLAPPDQSINTALGVVCAGLRAAGTCEGAECAEGCAGRALWRVAAAALAGCSVPGAPLPDHQRPAYRHRALTALLQATPEGEESPLCVLARHNAAACVRLLQASFRDAPFTGPLGKQNKLRVARPLLKFAPTLSVEGQIEILDFISGQMECGALPGEPELVEGCLALGQASEEGHSERGAEGAALRERRDRACVSLLARPPARPLLAGQLARPHASPRLRFHIHDILHQDNTKALDAFFAIHPRTERDVDSLFQFLRKISSDASFKDDVSSYLSPIVEARPKMSASLIGDKLPELIERALVESDLSSAVAFGRQLLEMNRLQGTAALTYFSILCQNYKNEPGDVESFLLSNSCLVTPEDALKIVQKYKLRQLEPFCLEAVGDMEAAVDCLVSLIEDTDDKREKTSLFDKACDLCTRVSATTNSETAKRCWVRVLECARDAGGGGGGGGGVVRLSALVGAAAHVEGWRVLQCGGGAGGARALLHEARDRAAAWRAAASLAAAEAAASTRRHLRRGARAVVVRRCWCAACGGAVSAALQPACACPCGALHHAAGGGAPTCLAGGRCAACRAPLSPPPPQPQPPAPPRARTPPRPHLDLCLVAPPRPDLEGLA